MKILFMGFLLIGLGSTPARAWERMITLNPMVAEWSALLLGKENALKKIVGTSEYSRFPEELKVIPTVGPYPQLQIEKIISLKSDLIVGSHEYNQPDQLKRLERLKLNVRVLPKETLVTMPEWIRTLGRILGVERAAEIEAEKWRHSYEQLKSPSRGRRVFFQIQLNPLITAGKSSFLSEAIEQVGYSNIFSDLAASYPKVSKEAVFSRKPDTVFVLEMVQNEPDRQVLRNEWKGLNLVFLDGNDFSRCSPRLLMALREMVETGKR